MIVLQEPNTRNDSPGDDQQHRPVALSVTHPGTLMSVPGLPIRFVIGVSEGGSMSEARAAAPSPAAALPATLHHTARTLGKPAAAVKAAVYQPISILAPEDLHLVNRFTGGPHWAGRSPPRAARRVGSPSNSRRRRRTRSIRRRPRGGRRTRPAPARCSPGIGRRRNPSGRRSPTTSAGAWRGASTANARSWKP